MNEKGLVQNLVDGSRLFQKNYQQGLLSYYTTRGKAVAQVTEELLNKLMKYGYEVVTECRGGEYPYDVSVQIAEVRFFTVISEKDFLDFVKYGVLNE